ncbi:MAG: hypothetical protein ACOC91_01320 [bacterium]
MSRPLTVILGIVVLAGLVLFVASLLAYDSAQLSLRGPSGEETTMMFRHSDRGGGEPGFFTDIAVDINEFFSDFGWYRDLNRAYFELSEPLRVLLNWIFGGVWALIFLRRR